jgi:hypothetical protein
MASPHGVAKLLKATTYWMAVKQRMIMTTILRRGNNDLLQLARQHANLEEEQFLQNFL